ncbi:MAG: hypothetical protein IPN67_04555 [Bacteroidales bacterium]|nr:hypothetical protein [Bacteroidales bacterium]
MENSCEVPARPKSIREFFMTRYFWKPFLGIISGVLAGYLYFHFVESPTHTWQIAGEAFSSMAFGGFLGFFVTSSPCSCFSGKC